MKRVPGSPDRSRALSGGFTVEAEDCCHVFDPTTPRRVSERGSCWDFWEGKPYEGLQRANRNIYNSICCCVFITDSCRACGITISLFNIKVVLS